MFVNYAIAVIVLVAGILINAIRQGWTNLTAARGFFFNLQEVPDIGGKLLMAGCWLLCPIMLPFILSKVVGPMYLDRYMISAAPALYLLIALGIYSIRRVVPMLVSLGVLIIMIAPSLGYYYATDSQEQWKEAAVYVDENSEPGDVIVFAPNQGIGIQQKTFNWYYPGVLPECGLGGEDGFIDSDKISDSLVQCISGHKRFWVVIRHYESIPGVADRYIDFFEGPGHINMKLIKENHVIGISIYLFKVD
jgi:mannosyltransferase